MIKLPKISIIIPAYNVEKYIAECLISVMQQTYLGAIECILVDDCGKDQSIDIAERLINDYSGTISFRILHHKHNRGLSAARNTGTDVATGDYIYYLDSDDFISNDCLEVLTKPLQVAEYDMVVGNYKMFGDRKDPSLLLEKQQSIIGNDAIFESYANRKICVMAWNKLCKLSFLKDNNIAFLEGQLHEDDYWTYNIMTNICSIAICHKISYYYRIRQNSIMTVSSNVERKIHSTFDTIRMIQAKPHKIKKSYYQCVLYYWNMFLQYAFMTNESFCKYYLDLRRTCPYNPLRLYLHKEMTLLELKHKLHFALPPLFGYWYLILRQYKNQSKQ